MKASIIFTILFLSVYLGSFQIAYGQGLQDKDTFFDYVLALVFAAFSIGVFFYLLNIYRIQKYVHSLKPIHVSLDTLRALAFQHKKPLPKFAIFVPARSEKDVIANTIKNLEELSYPKRKYKVFIITDERELKEQEEPRTKDIVLSLAKELNQTHGADFIRCIEVPEWYSGTFQSAQKTFERSTKGRALNYALQYLTERAEWDSFDMVGVLDADGRLHSHVLKDASYTRLTKNAQLLQGPVFQITNFSQVNIVGIAAGLELAIHHMTELPDRFRPGNRFQFLAGTNYFIDKNVLVEIGGWDQHALVEDAELALRLYDKKRITGNWLNAVEKEQTPPSFAVYRRQRERWARGHLRLLGYITKSHLPVWEKIVLLNKIALPQYRLVLDFGLPVFALILLLTGFLQGIGWFFTFLALFLLIATPFVWDLYGFMYRSIASYIDPAMTLRYKLLMSVRLLLFVPVLIVLQAIPRIEALYNFLLRPQEMEWYKTQRTKEA